MASLNSSLHLKHKTENQKSLSVSVFVGNLPAGLSQIQYEKILLDNLKNNQGILTTKLKKYLFSVKNFRNSLKIDVRWSKFDVIYYEYGAMVVLYDDPNKALKAYNILKDSVFDEKQLTVLILPSIQVYTVFFYTISIDFKEFILGYFENLFSKLVAIHTFAYKLSRLYMYFFAYVILCILCY